MRLHVVYDAKGSIAALGHINPDADAFDAPRSGPRAGDGQSVAEVELPDEYKGLTLAEVHDRFRVDVKAHHPRLVTSERG